MNKDYMIIDNGKPFDFGKISVDYAKYRDIYPPIFYEKIAELGLCLSGQTVLDIGTGTGVLPRNMYSYGAKWVGTDISENQIEQAKKISVEMDIDYYVMSAEALNFPDSSFDVITACQCYWYFQHEQTAPLFYDLLKDNGHLLFLRMDWLPFEDEIANTSESLVLKYNPAWSGAGNIIKPIDIPDCYLQYFDVVHHDEYKINVPFTREAWHGRMKSCRGIGASLTPDEIEQWETEHKALLEKIAPTQFEVLHYVAMTELKKKEVIK